MTAPDADAPRFDFGRNWAEFAKAINDTAVQAAREGLMRLFPTELVGARMIDIGCGSGLHSLAALQLGVREVVAVDLDPLSVKTTQSLLEAHAPGGAWAVTQHSVLDLPADAFDIVYCWGVLHHTGALHRALECAAAQTRPGGLFAFALYRRTPMCRFWTREKRFYSSTGQRTRAALEALYKIAFRASLAITGVSYARYVGTYARARGMSFDTDVRDWLGGYPYESISEAEVGRFMTQLGFSRVRSSCRKPGLGLLGTGCDEYVFRRTGGSDATRSSRP